LSQAYPVPPAGADAGWRRTLEPAMPLLELLERLVEVFLQPSPGLRPVRLRAVQTLSLPMAAPATQLFRQAEAALQRLRQPAQGRAATERRWRRCALLLPVTLHGQPLLLPLRIGHRTEPENHLDLWSLEFSLAPPEAAERLEFSLRLRATELSLQALCAQCRQASELQETLQEWVARLTRAGLQVDLWIAGLDARP